MGQQYLKEGSEGGLEIIVYLFGAKKITPAIGIWIQLV